MNKDYKKEEWGGWKIVSDMLDHPDENGIYPTSKCYQELYEFVVAQKAEQINKLKIDLQYTTKDKTTLERISNILKSYE